MNQTMNAEISRLVDAISAADAVMVGAGSGLSAAAGFTYSGERFQTYFADFIETYGFSDRVMDWGCFKCSPIVSARCTPYLRTTLMRWPTWLPDSISSSMATAKSA